MTPEETRTLELPSHLVSKVERRLPRSGFESPDEYVAFIVEEVLARVEPVDEERNKETEEEIETRLESLGYLE